MPAYRRILVPVDGSATSNKALVAALQLARDVGAKVQLVHAVEELAFVSGFEYSGDVVGVARAAGEKVLQDAAAIAQSAGVESDVRLIEFPAQRLGETIAEAVRQFEADLIVVGTHGRRGIGRLLLGSGAEQVIRLAPVPVLVIRGGEA